LSFAHRGGGSDVFLRATVRLAAALAVGGLVGCGGASSHATPTSRPADQPGPPIIPVDLTDAGCVPTSFTLRPGDVVFAVTNTGTKKVTEMEVQWPNGHVKGDVEGVQPGHSRSLALKLAVGTYRVRCPQSAPTGGTITVQ
jgi:iron uptake system component EfeO